MKKIIFEDTTVVKQPYVEINGVEHEVHGGEYQGGTDLDAETFNTMQNNIAGYIDGEESMGSIIVEDIECKNLLNITVSTTTINGVTFTVNEDKSITLNGTSNATTSLKISNEKITKPMNYIFGITTDFSSIEHNFEVGGYVYDSNGTYKRALSTNNPTISLNNGEYVTNWFIYFTSGAVFNNFTIYPQLEKGTIATDYVEHKEFSNKQIYSTSETVIGTWIDGKTLYRKTFTGSLVNNGSKDFDSGLTNENICKMYGVARENTSGFTLPIPHVNISSVNNGIKLDYNKANHKLNVSSSGNLSGYTAYVTIEYTKTTD